jgi:cephalosporin-C deacetylase-like acetyl esterase
MPWAMRAIMLRFVVPALLVPGLVSHADPLPGTRALVAEDDLAAQMVAGIDRWLMRAIDEARTRREAQWKRALGTGSQRDTDEAREQYRALLMDSLGMPVPPPDGAMYLASPGGSQQKIAESDRFDVYRIQWRVLEGLTGEGVLLEPRQAPKASVIALPDADIAPETLCQLDPFSEMRPEWLFPVVLAQRGCRVVVPLLIDTRSHFSGHERVRMTQQPHREFIYRAAYELGAHIIGLEVLKIQALIHWLDQDDETRIGVFGMGEGGLLALYAAALDERIDAAAVCGYFGPRDRLWEEPIYRNVWRLLRNFGDAELAALVAPRGLVVECAYPGEAAAGPRSIGGEGAAPGLLRPPEPAAVAEEWRRAETYVPEKDWPHALVQAALPFDPQTYRRFGEFLGVTMAEPLETLAGLRLKRLSGENKETFERLLDQRMRRQVRELMSYTQRLLEESPARRKDYWKDAQVSSLEAWEKSAAEYRRRFHTDVIGKLPEIELPPNARTRRVYDTDKFTGYEVMLDVYPEVFACGILLLPKNLREGERRPVVVCQHGLEGRPQDVADPAVDNPYYHRFACRLTEAGFITYAPQNPYLGGDAFRVLQRKANPLGLSLFSFIVEQHRQTLNWLKSLPQVDPARIAFYGLSYGGKTAMRVPAILTDYCLSICSADFNEWIWKNAKWDSPYSYLYTGEYEMPEFNLGNTFNYAEMSWLIFPRPFMVERGHDDGVAPDEWVAYEYARTRRHYVKLGLADRTEIEFFDGPHTIHGAGTFAFLRKHLRWPGPPSPP